MFGPKCPICKQELNLEMIAMDVKEDENGNVKKKINFGNSLMQIINYAVESGIRASVGSGRSLYYTCGNPDCPACFKGQSPCYFKKGIIFASLVGDPNGIRLDFMKGAYRKRKALRKVASSRMKK